MTRLSLCVLLLLILLPDTAVQAQPGTVVADTLDWHRYYPLAIGDTWEYEVMEGEPLRVHRIIGDSLASNHHYFLMEIITWNFDYSDGGTWRDTLFVRYSEVGGIFRLPSPEADTVATPQNMGFWDGSRGYYDLRTAFGDSVYYSTGVEDYYVTSGGYQESVGIGGQTYIPAALKHFNGGVMWETYAADIGLLRSINLFGPVITYAKVSEVEYGVSRIPTAIADEAPLPDRFAIEAIYPNPINDRATIRYRLPEPQEITLEIFDVIGRKMSTEALTAMSAGIHVYEFHTANEIWATGVYFVRLVTRDGQQSVRPMILIR
ncbi:MAG: T9SS type A sorting domain-containing protein [Bacteroidetes bacterium]|nr:T9SS type A sorting domain-containing protein [Bacteroidota bacterium]